VMKYFSGFVLRYQQYLEFDLILILVLLAATKFKQHPLKSLQFFMIVTILLSCLFFYFKNTKDLNSLKFVEWNEINYSLGRETLFEWLKYKLPDVSDATIYCDTHAGEPLGLVILDPDMIWFTRNGLNRVFMLGCYYYYPPNLSVDGWKDVVTVAKERRLQFWTISANPCVSPDKLEPGLEKNKADQKFKMRQINNLIVCNSTEVAKNLYYFDYEKLK
jgi:hypothetical protein